MTTYRCIDIGRNKFNGTIKAKDERAILRQIGRHLMSRNVDLVTEDDGQTWTVLVGGFREVGRLVRLDAYEQEGFERELGDAEMGDIGAVSSS